MSQNQKDLQTQGAKIKQTIEKVLDQDISLTERILTLFREQRITIFLILTALSMTISAISFTIGGVFGRAGWARAFTAKEKGVLKKCLHR